MRGLPPRKGGGKGGRELRALDGVRRRGRRGVSSSLGKGRKGEDYGKGRSFALGREGKERAIYY